MLRFAAACLVIGGPAALAASAPVQPVQTTLDEQLRQALAEAGSAKAEQRRLEQAAARARDEVTRLRGEQLAAAQAIAAAEAEISAADARARLALARLELQRDRLATIQSPLSSLLGGLALMARRPPLMFLADSGSVEEMVKLRILLKATAPAIQARTASLSLEFDRAGQLEQAAALASGERRRRRDQLAARRDAFAALESRAVELARSRGSEALGAGDVAIASQEELAGLQSAASSRASAARLAGELAALGPAPLPASPRPPPPPFAYRLPAAAPVIDGLGEVSANGVRSRGITLGTRRGAALAAPARGTILFSGPFRDYDGIVIIDHGDGWKSVLVNAGSSLAKGKTVRIGEPIGLALGPVDVELQSRGNPVSPALIAGSSAVLSNQPKGG